MAKFIIANRFEINDLEKDLLGRGGMGMVYRALDTQTGETVAVKALNADALADEPSLLERFRREGQALRQLNHPNIVKFIAALESNGQHFIVMEYIDGGSLQDLLAAQGALPSQRAIEIGIDLADALSRAHRLGIIYRDLKPANVLLAKDGTPRLSDFGIVQLADSSPLTQTGMLVGTVNYLSPEAINSEPLDNRADIWAFGVLLFEMLTGRLPFTGKNLTARITAILTQPVPDLAQLAPDVPPALINLINYMLQKDPQQRIPGMRQIGAELEAILKGRESVTPTPAASQPVARNNNLPSQLTAFIGREREMADLTGLLRKPDVRLVTLTGTGGTGKTRLSLQAATKLFDEFPDGVWFVELAAISDPNLVLPAIASVFKVTETAGTLSEQSLIDTLRDRKLLLVIDNFEQVVSAATLLGRILAGAPGVKLLVSSREVLHLRSEHDFPVPPLGLPTSTRIKIPAAALAQYEAIALFIQHAQAANPAFELNDDNAASVAEICIKLDGLPLAIELAAARSRLLKPPVMLEKLKNRLSVLTGGARDLPHRQQTIRGAIDWSYELLDEDEKNLFARLGVFVGGWTLDAAETVCSNGLSLDVLDGLESLLDKSLLRQVDGANGETRFSMLETIREYALEKLTMSGELLTIQQAHAGHISALLDQVNAATNGPQEAECFAKLDGELDNLRAAVEWCLLHDRLLLPFKVIDAQIYWFQRENTREPLAWMERALAGNFHLDDAAQAKTLKNAGAIYFYNQKYNQARTYFQTALDFFRKIDDQDGIARCLNNLGNVEFRGEENFDKARELYEQCLAVGQSDTTTAAGALRALGDIANERGDFQAARDYYLRSREISARLGDEVDVSMSDFNLGSLAFQQRDLVEARKRYVSYGNSSWVRIFPLEVDILGGILGYIDVLSGNKEDGRTLLDKALIAQQIKNQNSEPEIYPNILEGKARLEHAEGSSARAAQLLGACARMRKNNAITPREFERENYDAVIAQARAVLGDAAFDAAFAKGQAMSPDQAIEFALQEADQ